MATILGKDDSTTTTDATVTTLGAHVIAEGESATYYAVVRGYKSDLSASAHRVVWAGVRRAAAGNVTLVGSVQGDAIQEDSGGTPAITIVVDTGTQTVEVNVTGIAAETWNWRVMYSVVV